MTNLKKLAVKTARKSPHPIHKHASIVIKGGAVLAVGFNHHGIHAEVAALKKLWPSKRVGTTVVNLRLTSGGRLGKCDPCPVCMRFLRESGVAKVVCLEE